MSLTRSTLEPTPAVSDGKVMRMLKGRLLTVTNTDAVAVAAHIDLSHGGLVLSEVNSPKKLKVIRKRFPTMLLVAEPRGHMEYASEEAPLVFPAPDPDDGLFTMDPLTKSLDLQVASGASFAIIPAGFVGAGDVPTLRTIMETVNQVDRDDCAVLLALHSKFLLKDLDTLITIVNMIKHPVLIMFGATGNPLSTKKKRAGYRRLFMETTHAVPWRTDLAGIDAMMHGAEAAAVGMLPSQRRCNYPGKTGYSPNKADRSPNMLYVELLTYFKSSKLRRMFVTSKPPLCGCAACAGKALDRLDSSPHDRSLGHLHDALVIQDLHQRLSTATDPKATWKKLLGDAVSAASALGGRIGQSVDVADDIRDWATATAPQPTPVP